MVDIIACFTEAHRSVLNRMLRQSTVSLESGPFAVLANHTRILDFDVKRRHFRSQLSKLSDSRRMMRDDFGIHVRRSHVFEVRFLLGVVVVEVHRLLIQHTVTYSLHTWGILH